MSINSIQEQVVATRALIRQTVAYCAQLKIADAQTQKIIAQAHILIAAAYRSGKRAVADTIDARLASSGDAVLLPERLSAARTKEVRWIGKR